MPTRSDITRVNDVMSSAPKSVSTSTTIDQLLELFDRHDFNAFPVTNDANELVGIVTKVDLLRDYAASPSFSTETVVPSSSAWSAGATSFAASAMLCRMTREDAGWRDSPSRRLQIIPLARS